MLKELETDYGLDQDQASALIKAMVTNGIIAPKKVGAALFYTGTALSE
jgi:hypothetical protein